MKNYDIIIIGGGLSGMTAALSAREKGIKDILILEREDYLGGILVQCIHHGFGENILEETLTGPEFAQYFINRIEADNIEYRLNTMVLDLNKDKVVTAVNPEEGIVEFKGKAIILATGCREKYNGNINVPMNKYAGIYTVGSAHKFINFQGYLPGKNVVILGSSDIALIVSRRLILEGAKVKAIVEKQPYIHSHRKNLAKCIEDFNLPLKLGYSITDVLGNERIKGVKIAEVDENGRFIKDTEEYIECDTLLLSVGWMPESDLAEKAKIKLSQSTGGPEVNDNYETTQGGVFACGNLIHTYSWANDVAIEGGTTGVKAADFIENYLK
ncbi:NAD(P)/FAD-dependent oxidoreductase, partial [Clostridium polynesiense]|uniref:NAD(P)/FAD-dependent oxidoreductase n=1 Tax=Clostridium polynesiense TaxID=1325933 RepID=UPI00059056ED